MTNVSSCPRCEYADVIKRGKNQAWYHLIYHTWFGHIYWFPVWFKDLMQWYRIFLHRDYFGKFSWHGWKGFIVDLKSANEMMELEYYR
jgi:hypothetical protein